MKKSDIEVGKTYAYSTWNKRGDSMNINHDPKPAKVVSLTESRESYRSRFSKADPSRVMVEIVETVVVRNENGTVQFDNNGMAIHAERTVIKAVPIWHLHGEYESAIAKQDLDRQTAKIARENRERLEAEKQARRDEVMPEIQEQLAKYGVRRFDIRKASSYSEIFSVEFTLDLVIHLAQTIRFADEVMSEFDDITTATTNN